MMFGLIKCHFGVLKLAMPKQMLMRVMTFLCQKIPVGHLAIMKTFWSTERYHTRLCPLRASW